jgi:NitT/TauT family transport system substrate-binding protein
MPAIRRRQFSTAAALAAASLAVPVRGAQGRLEKARLMIAVGGKASFYHLPLTIAAQLGYFRAEGLDVDIVESGGGGRALQAVTSGEADVVSAAYLHLVPLQARGQVLQAFVLQGRAPQMAFGVSTRTLPGFQSMQALKGRRIGVTELGSSTHVLARLLLSRYGIQSGEVSFVGVGAGAGALNAMRAGQLDAVCSIEPLITLLEQKGDVRVIYDTRSLRGTQEVFGGPMPAACLCAPLEFVQKHPQTVQALSDAMVHGLKWLQTAGPRDIIKTVPEAYQLGEPGLYLSAFSKVRETLSIDGVFPEDGGRTVLRTFSSVDPAFKAEKIDLGKTYTNQFALRAKARFKA